MALTGEQEREGVGSGVSCMFEATLTEEKSIQSLRTVLEQGPFTYHDLVGLLHQGKPDPNTSGRHQTDS